MAWYAKLGFNSNVKPAAVFTYRPWKCSRAAESNKSRTTVKHSRNGATKTTVTTVVVIPLPINKGEVCRNIAEMARQKLALVDAC